MSGTAEMPSGACSSGIAAPIASGSRSSACPNTGLAAAAKPVFGHAELRLPLAIGAAIPLLQAPEGISAVPLMLRGRYDVRGLFLAFSMGLRLVAIAVAASHGLAWTIAAIAVAQGIASLG